MVLETMGNYSLCGCLYHSGSRPFNDDRFLMVVFYDILPVAILAYVINLQSKSKLFE